MRRAAFVVAALCSASAVALTVLALATWPRPTQDFGSQGPVARTDVVPPVRAGLGTGVKVRSSSPDQQEVRVVPTSIAVTSVGLDMPVTATGLNAQGGLALPDTSLEAVWFRHGAVPGELQDAALIAAHVDNRLTGVGPFARLSELDTGATVAVTLSDGSVVEYTAVRRERVPKEQINFAKIMSESAGMLLLVTCGGRFDTTTGHYEDNVIVWASPTQFAWSTP